MHEIFFHFIIWQIITIFFPPFSFRPIFSTSPTLFLPFLLDLFLSSFFFPPLLSFFPISKVDSRGPFSYDKLFFLFFFLGGGGGGGPAKNFLKKF